MNLRDQLQAIYDDQGKLTPEIVVDTARSPAHPLHARFEWNDAIAGSLYRRAQAHDLIQSAQITYKRADSEELLSVRAFQAVRLEEGYVYEPSEKVAQEPLLREIVLRDMEREWRQLYSRYGTFQEFLDIVDADLKPKRKRRRKAS